MTADLKLAGLPPEPVELGAFRGGAPASTGCNRRPDCQLVAELSKIGQRMADEWLPGAGADGAAWLEAVRASKPTAQP